MGGPPSRSRTELIRSTVLGLTTGDIVCPRRVGLALDFGGDDPHEAMFRLLSARGLSDPNLLRDELSPLPPAMLCRRARVRALKVGKANADRVLWVAFLLGLCTAVYFDPGRAVLWTTASLTRRLALYDTAGFYA